MKFFKIIKRLILLLIVFGLLSFTYYAYFVSPNDYTITHYTYKHKSIPSNLSGLKIAFISDLNLNKETGTKKLEKAIDELNDQPFDIIIFGGDLYDGDIFQNKEISSLLKKITCKYGKFAVIGEKDKDNENEVIQILNNGGFEVLNNETRTLYYKDTSFVLAAGNEELDISKLNSTTQTIKVCVSHQPDTFINNKGKIDLQLSGHSYGGSIYIPYLGAILPIDGARAYNHGTYEEDNSTLYVSNGFSGPYSFPYKLFARNQILIITLKTQTQEKEG